ncbi:MAG: metallophosphoesterase [Deltaproteobacteria bacterium]|nr:metallophosphoesterase [Deltaproteobacteria bacterium]
MRIAHVSDLHVLSKFGDEWRRALFNKRITGYVNVLMHRGRVYRRDYLRAVLAEAARQAEHVVVTGDITNLSHESEYAEARKILSELGARVEVTVVPGNHDIYLPEIAQHQRFSHHFEPFLKSDLPEAAVEVAAGRFPVVKLRGSVALIGLSTAVPRPPFVSAGRLGKAQLAALKSVLSRPEVATRTPVVLLHHDPLDTPVRFEQLRSGLVDAGALRSELSHLRRGLILFGHLHVRRHSRLETGAGALDVVCASGASLDHRDPRVAAGFNLYDIADDGAVGDLEAWVLDPETERFSRGPIPPGGPS